MDAPMTDAIGTSDIFLSFQERLGQLAAADRPVLVLGERGTGKELAVQRLHYLSLRWEKPLITVLCPALSPALLESELFGHEAGAFTGARGRHAGVFERADGGTLFLDEVADMPLPLQDKLLRVIEYGGFERVGGVTPVRVDVRVVAATNRNLPELVSQGAFRADLLDRLAFDVLHVPPLRMRGEDRLLLARHFASGMAAELDVAGRGAETADAGSSGQRDWSELGPAFGKTALQQLEQYSWPGNVRELRNAVERTVLHRRSLHLESLDMDPFASPYAPQAWGSAAKGEPSCFSCPSCPPVAALPPVPSAPTAEAAPPHPWHVDVFSEEMVLKPGFCLPKEIQKQEKAFLRAALKQAQFRQAEAARLLGVSYHQFRALYRKYADAAS